jgi:ribosomal protein S18 acetylase RimI-like enzyme
MNLKYEPAKEEDLDLLFSMNKDLIDRYEDIGAIDYPAVLNWVRKNLRDNLGNFSRVLADGEVTAYFCLVPGPEKWEVDSLFVLEPFRNKGIGSAILDHCIRQSGGKLYFYVFSRNTGALRLYRRKGFAVTQKIKTSRYIMEYES